MPINVVLENAIDGGHMIHMEYILSKTKCSIYSSMKNCLILFFVIAGYFSASHVVSSDSFGDFILSAVGMKERTATSEHSK